MYYSSTSIHHSSFDPVFLLLLNYLDTGVFAVSPSDLSAPLVGSKVMGPKRSEGSCFLYLLILYHNWCQTASQAGHYNSVGWCSKNLFPFLDFKPNLHY